MKVEEKKPQLKTPSKPSKQYLSDLCYLKPKRVLYDRGETMALWYDQKPQNTKRNHKIQKEIAVMLKLIETSDIVAPLYREPSCTIYINLHEIDFEQKQQLLEP